MIYILSNLRMPCRVFIQIVYDSIHFRSFFCLFLSEAAIQSRLCPVTVLFSGTWHLISQFSGKQSILFHFFLFAMRHFLFSSLVFFFFYTFEFFFHGSGPQKTCVQDVLSHLKDKMKCAARMHHQICQYDITYHLQTVRTLVVTCGGDIVHWYTG